MKQSKIALLLAGAMMASLLFSGCAKTEEPKKDDPTQKPVEQPADNKTDSKNVQELKVAINTTVATLDPALISTTTMAHINNNTGSFLFRVQADGTHQKELCKDYTISEDGLTYTFEILDNVKWSDGQPLKAEHFVYALKRTIGYGPDNAYAARNLVTFVKGAKAASDAAMDVAAMTDVGINVLSDYKFEIVLDKPCPYFIKLFSGGVASPLRPDFAKEHESTWALQAGYPSLGAMTMDEINPAEMVSYKKNPNFIYADKVTVDKIIYQVMPDMSAQLNAFKAGQIDVALTVPTEVGANEQYKNSLYKGDAYTSTYFVSINTGDKNTVPALKDPKVRKAMALAIDKDTMIGVLNGGPYITKLDGFIPFGFQGVEKDFRSEISYHEYNLEEAQKLMTEAGYSESNPLTFEYLYANAQFHADVAQMLQQLWSKIYIKADLKSVEGGVYYDFIDNGDFQTGRYANSDATDPLNYFKIFTTEGQIPGCGAINDTKYDQMVAEAYNITDPVEYAKKLHEIEDYMVGEMAYIVPLFTQEPVILVNENLQGMWTAPSGTLSFTTMTNK